MRKAVPTSSRAHKNWATKRMDRPSQMRARERGAEKIERLMRRVLPRTKSATERLTEFLRQRFGPSVFPYGKPRKEELNHA